LSFEPKRSRSSDEALGAITSRAVLGGFITNIAESTRTTYRALSQGLELVAGTTPDVRLVGFNAPETTRAQCPEERALGEKADRRLREIVRGGDLDFSFVACSCRSGTEGTPICNYGRKCGTLRARGRDVGAMLIAEALAVRFVCGTSSCPATPRPWCK
jgi:endonuclease YncB( thermonuclease family)